MIETKEKKTIYVQPRQSCNKCWGRGRISLIKEVLVPGRGIGRRTETKLCGCLRRRIDKALVENPGFTIRIGRPKNDENGKKTNNKRK